MMCLARCLGYREIRLSGVRVLLFVTNSCVAWQSHTHLVYATIRVLTWNGFEIVMPKEFKCCGAGMMYSNRHPDITREITRQKLEDLMRHKPEALMLGAWLVRLIGQT
ncbi:hypothetical protein Vsou_05250 [Vulcanisaeta souniana JCM 11219]|uniref:Cysteine-rich domain-containing protein n=2 Tax=Vulcanisaeta souniana TaxID=164452 RepID=A0ABN6SR30_9CREN|nr:hypothetical protein Vsou_05250 [Vulcanisaeta souniana JCM 11219]